MSSQKHSSIKRISKSSRRKSRKSQSKRPSKKKSQRRITISHKSQPKHSENLPKRRGKADSPIVNKSSKNVRIKVIGVGGAGNNVLSRMQGKISGIELISMNTDLQGLRYSKANVKIQIGPNACRGLGAGMDPNKGREAAEESREDINKLVKNSDLIFITCGLGGGTGSGAAPIVASMAKQTGALVVAVVTNPFDFEGEKRREVAEEAWQKLFNEVDAIVTIPNDRVFNVIDKDTSILQAFNKIDDVLRQGVQGISNLITYPGLINLDFANIKTILSNAGNTLMGIGKARGKGRAPKAAQLAINSPLLDISIEGATQVLFNIAGGKDMSLVEIHDAARVITQSISKDARVIFGTSFDKDLKKHEVKVTVIAGGFEGENKLIDNSLPLEMKIPVDEIKESRQKQEDKELENIFSEDKELEIPAFLRHRNKNLKDSKKE